jgi:ribosomal-protein-alanine N-acetyltransferase
MSNDSRVIVETEHLLFRPLTLSDLDDLTALYADPEVMRFLSGPRDREEVKQILVRYMQEYQIFGQSFFAVILKAEQRFIGHCGLVNQEVAGKPEVELVYVLAQTYWQQGLALEGTQALKDYGLQQQGLPRLISLIPPDNSASVHIAEKIGMRYERDIDQWGTHFQLYAAGKSEPTNA